MSQNDDFRIENHVLLECLNKNIIDAKIPYGVNVIDKYAFVKCKSLQTVDIPDTVTKIGQSAFGMCFALESVKIPSGIRKLKYGTFEFCKSLKNISLPNRLTTIGKNAFLSCNALHKVNIPNRVTQIGKDAFCGMDNLTELSVPRHLMGNENNWGLTVQQRINNINWYEESKTNLDMQRQSAPQFAPVQHVDTVIPQSVTQTVNPTRINMLVAQNGHIK